MKIFLYPFLLSAIFISCSTSADYLKSTDPDYTYFKLVKKIKKAPSDRKIIEYLPAVYQQASERHLTIIRDLKESKDTGRVENIFREYQTLQKMFDTISAMPAIAEVVCPKSYQNEISFIQKKFSEKYYQQGMKSFASETRNDKMQAIEFFKKTLFFNSAYKDCEAKLDEAYKSSMVNVVISPLINDPAPVGPKMEQVLRDDLKRKDKKIYPADYFTADESVKKKIIADWIVYVTISNVNIATPTVTSSTTNYTRQVENGKDSLGRIMYETVFGSVTDEKASGSATALVNITIMDTDTGDNIYDSTFATSNSYSNETRTFSGDSRADDNVRTSYVANNSASPYDQLMGGIKNNLPPLVEKQILKLVANKELE